MLTRKRIVSVGRGVHKKASVEITSKEPQTDVEFAAWAKKRIGEGGTINQMALAHWIVQAQGNVRALVEKELGKDKGLRGKPLAEAAQKAFNEYVWTPRGEPGERKPAKPRKLRVTKEEAAAQREGKILPSLAKKLAEMVAFEEVEG